MPFDSLLLILICDLYCGFFCCCLCVLGCFFVLFLVVVLLFCFVFSQELCLEHKGFVSVSEYFCWHLMWFDRNNVNLSQVVKC